MEDTSKEMRDRKQYKIVISGLAESGAFKQKMEALEGVDNMKITPVQLVIPSSKKKEDLRSNLNL